MAAEAQEISQSQKGFMLSEGCLEHNFVLRAIVDDARRHMRSVCVIWLELANAFGSVPHQHIARSLQRIGLHERSMRIINELQRDNLARICTVEGLTRAMLVTKGPAPY